MNFNYSKTNTYTMYGNQTAELINLYGIKCKLLITEKINVDNACFGDYQSIKTNNKDTFLVSMMPESTDQYDNLAVNFSEFGMLNVETISLFVSRKSVMTIFENMQNINFYGYNGNQELTDGNYELINGNVNLSVRSYNSSHGIYAFKGGVDLLSPVKNLQSNLVILPNNRVMEITDVEFLIPGLNNLFTEQDVKNVYRLVLKTYDRKLTDNLESMNDKNTEIETVGSYKELDSYFNELMNKDESVDNDAKMNINIDTEKPTIAPTDDVFGRF